jgi:hypothetical protein
MPELLLGNYWAGPSIWALLFISDYTLTLTCARLYVAGVRDKIAFEGSYELTPFFQRDIDLLRRISPRFILILLLIPFLLVVLRFLTFSSIPEIYAFSLGAFILTQLSIHIRHFRNLYLFGVAKTDQVRGRIEYARRISLTISSIEMLSFCGMFLVIFAFTQSWFVLGGSLSCLSIAMKHRRLSNQHAPATPQPEKAQSAGTTP